MKWLSSATLATALCACGPAPATPWVWSLPTGTPAPKVPADNQLTTQKVALGRRLFYDVRLSRNEQQACSTCHEQAKAFTDGRQHAVGSTGQNHRRNVQPLMNIGWASALTWASPLIGTLERQAMLPLFGESPVELGWAGHEDELVARFAMSRDDAVLFEAAFPNEGVTVENITKALASFERTMISFGSPYDRYVAGDASALSADAKAGLELFNTERLECYHCHVGFTFSDAVAHENTGAAVDRPFHNTGLYDTDGRGAYPVTDTGVYELTNKATDMGKFRAPTLRNLRFTAPFMHDGSIATLGEVIDVYAAGGRAMLQSGKPNPLQSNLVRGFVLTADERRQLEAFLDSLNDDAFIAEPSLSDPFAR